jgi:hypothetical protein
MPTSLKQIASNAGKKDDGLKQTQREAIVDLLHYCMFTDNFVALKEDQFVNTVAATLSWDKNISFESYEGGSIGNARRAKESQAFREQFLPGIAKRLETKEARQLAFNLCKDLYNADSNLADGESQTLAALKKLLA